MKGYLLSFVIALVTVELVVTDDYESNITWSFLDANCKSSPTLELTQNRVYKKNCALRVGQTYVLKCDHDRSGQGWGSSFLVIENSRYCEYSGGSGTPSKPFNVTITGKLASL